MERDCCVSDCVPWHELNLYLFNTQLLTSLPEAYQAALIPTCLPPEVNTIYMNCDNRNSIFSYS